MTYSTRTVWFALVLIMVAVLGLPAGAARAHSERCFPQTNHCIRGRFRQYWEQNGGLAVFGYPLGPAREERNVDTGATYLTQWFERNRFELHPENVRPYDVLLGRLGVDRLHEQGRAWQRLPTAAPSTVHYFPQTSHAIGHEPFWHYWSTHGVEFDQQRGTSLEESIALFGYPISEPALETNASGDTVLTQWFERARFEYHPAKSESQTVLLGLLGVGGTDTCSRVKRIAPTSAEGSAIGQALLAGIPHKMPALAPYAPFAFAQIRSIDRAGDWILFNASFQRVVEPAIFVMQATPSGYRFVDVGWAGAPGDLTAADIRAAIARVAPDAPPELPACASLEGFLSL